MYTVLIDPITRRVITCIEASYETYRMHYEGVQNALYISRASFPTEAIWRHFMAHYTDYYMNHTGALRYIRPVARNDNTPIPVPQNIKDRHDV